VNDYRVFLNYEVMETLRRLRGPDRLLVGRFIESLGPDPFQEGDYKEKDSSGRYIEIKTLGRHVLFFWADHPVSEVKVVGLGKVSKT